MEEVPEEVQHLECGVTSTVILNRPKKLNCLNLRMIATLSELWDTWAASGERRVVLLKGAGGRAFCAGGDVARLREAGLAADFAWCRNFFYKEYAFVARTAAEAPVIQVSLWDGFVMGGGAGISLLGRYRLATEKTVFSFPEGHIGFFPDVGASYVLSRLPRCYGTYISLTARRLSAPDTVISGLATHFVKSDDIPSLEAELKALTSVDEDSVEAVLRQYTVSDIATIGASELAQHASEIENCFKHDTIEKILQALQAQGTAWTRKVLEDMMRLSPTSLKVSLECLRRGRHLSINQCLDMEYKVALQFMTPGSDFYEGVRAVLVDKDQAPRWHQALSEIKSHEVASYFDRVDSLELNKQAPWLMSRF